MKFSHQLKFNSVADWKDHYVHYANLKKVRLFRAIAPMSHVIMIEAQAACPLCQPCVALHKPFCRARPTASCF